MFLWTICKLRGGGQFQSRVVKRQSNAISVILYDIPAASWGKACNNGDKCDYWVGQVNNWFCGLTLVNFYSKFPLQMYEFFQNHFKAFDSKNGISYCAAFAWEITRKWRKKTCQRNTFQIPCNNIIECLPIPWAHNFGSMSEVNFISLRVAPDENVMKQGCILGLFEL